MSELVRISKENPLDYYASQSVTSNPGKHANLFGKLPDSVEDLCEIVHGVIIHRDNTEDLYEFKPTAEEYEESNLRYVEDILGRIVEKDSSPLSLRREPRKRCFGSCRDFAILLCSILRFKGVPARIRCGFGAYLERGKYWDHWVCEYWSKRKGKWILIDPEVGEEERQGYGISRALDTTDLPRDQFIVAGQAWNMCRSKKEDPNLFGVHSIGIYGAWFIRANVLRDLVALNKIELLPWDYTDFFHKFFVDLKDLKPSEIELIDSIANLTSSADNDRFKNIRSLYGSNRKLQVGSKVRSYSTEKPVIVNLRK